MSEHAIGSREQWLEANKRLLEREKELTRRGDELARERQELPWVAVEKQYSFETNEGTRTLAELFDGRSQLIGLPLHAWSQHSGGLSGMHLCDGQLQLLGRPPERT